MYVISPTIFSPGFSAEKSRLTRSDSGWPGPCSVSDARHGLGWHGSQLQLAHQLADELLARLLAAADQRGVQAPIAVFLVVRLEQRLDLQLGVFPAAFLSRFAAVTSIRSTRISIPPAIRTSG